MTEKNSLSASIEIYISKQESVALEFIRRALQAETKVAMLEEVLSQTKQKLEIAEEQTANCNSTLNQSINGLSALQVEKEQYKSEASRLSAEVADLRSKLEVERDLKETIQRLTSELETKKSNYAALSKAYYTVENQLEETTNELNALKLQTRPKAKVKSGPTL